MDYKKKIREKIEKMGGFITSGELVNSNIPTIYLTRMVEAGELVREERGVYLSAKGDYDEYYLFQNKYKVAIFSYVSALYLFQFTDIIPSELEVTVYKGYNASRIQRDKRVHYVNKDIYELGITQCKTAYGNKVNVYDLERTICDFIKNRNEIETELFSKTMNRYVRDKNKDLNRLYEYSKKMRIYDKVKNILEVIYE